MQNKRLLRFRGKLREAIGIIGLVLIGVMFLPITLPASFGVWFFSDFSLKDCIIGTICFPMILALGEVKHDA